MSFTGGMSPYEIKDLFYKLLILFGVLIIIYGVLWLLAKLSLIPAIIFAIFPQLVLILVGIFIVYVAVSKRREY